MGVGVEDGLPGPREELPEAEVAGEVGAEDERVDEEADEAFGLGPGAAGDGRADDDVVLAGVRDASRVWKAASRVMKSVAPSCLGELAESVEQRQRRGPWTRSPPR